MGKCKDQKTMKSETHPSVLEKFEILKAYERTTDYWTLSSMFKCNINQVKAIVEHKQSVLDEYSALPIEVRTNYEEDQRLRAEKIDLLDKTVYEYFLRARRNSSSVPITNSFFKKIALGANSILHIKNFSANNAWLLGFRVKYDIQNSDMKRQPNDPGPLKLDIMEVIGDVIKREKNDETTFISPCTYEVQDSDVELIETFTGKRMSRRKLSLANDADPISTEPEPAKKMEPNVPVFPSTNNPLTLFDKIQAIRAYERIGNYEPVALLFNCDIKQISGVIANKEILLETYLSLPSEVIEDYEESQHRRVARLVLLNKTVYEWFLRARRNRYEGSESVKFPLRKIALKVKRIFYVDNFVPDCAWLTLFLKTYNITKQDIKLQPNDTGPKNLDIREILADVIKEDKIGRPTSKEPSHSDGSHGDIWDFFQCRATGSGLDRSKKLSIFDKAMFKWFLKARLNPSLCPISNTLIKKIAWDVKYILNIGGEFFPNNAWLKFFREKHHITESSLELGPKETGPSDVDIEAIVSQLIIEEESRLDSLASYDCDDNTLSLESFSILMSINQTAFSKHSNCSQLSMEPEGFLSQESDPEVHSEGSSDEKVHIPLSLQHIIRVIEAYKKTNSCSTVARMFHSRPEDIRTIISNKKKTLAMLQLESLQRKEYYKRHGPMFFNRPDNVRLRKVTLHNTVMFEWFLRARRNPSVGSITNELILKVANEAKEALYIDSFSPDNSWLSKFRRKYNIRDVDLKRKTNDPGPMDLDIKAIITEFSEEKFVSALEDCDDDSSASCSLHKLVDVTAASSSRLSEENGKGQHSSKSANAWESERKLIKPIVRNKEEMLAKLLSEDTNDKTRHLVSAKELSDKSTESKIYSLSLLDKARVLEAYKETNCYSTVARMFRSKPENIRKIVEETLDMLQLEGLQVKRNYKKQGPKILNRPEYVRQRKVAQHNTVMFEWFQRARRNPCVGSITNELILKVATEVNEALNIDSFFPNSSWLSQFLRKYNIKDADLKSKTNDPGPMELDVKAIITEFSEKKFVSAMEDFDDDSSASCSHSNPTNGNEFRAENGKGLHSSESANAWECEKRLIERIVDNKKETFAKSSSEQTSQEVSNKTRNPVREKKVTLLGRVVFEWFLRARRNPSVSSITKNTLLDVANDAKDVLQFYGFVPTNLWILGFLEKYNITTVDMDLRPNDSGPTELDIRSIVRDVLRKEIVNRPCSSPCETAYSQDNSSNSVASNSRLSNSESESEVSVVNPHDTNSKDSTDTEAKANIDSKRTQNRLSVLEKYQALKAFEKFGNFTMVCRFFNCGVDQIRSIVVNKQKVTGQYCRAQKILLLGKVVYEWFLRARRSRKMRITYNMIKETARAVRKEMNIDTTFIPNNSWLAEFCQINNITNNDMLIRKNEAGSKVLNIKAIVAEVTERESKNVPTWESDDIMNCHDDSADTSKVSNPESLNNSQHSDNTSTTAINSSASAAKSTDESDVNTSKKKVDSVECNQTVTRIQNRLSLFDKLQAIKAYEDLGNYTKVARLFNCSIDQIKSIVVNKQKFLDTYGSLPHEVRKNYEETQSLRAERIALINKIVYEWFLRARRNRSEELSSIYFSFFQRVALDVRKVLRVDNFFPNNAWLAQFLEMYNITTLDMKPKENDHGPKELNIASIVKDVLETEDCNSKNIKLTKIIVDKQEIQSKNELCKTQNLIRAKKVNLVEKVMFEWFLRARRNPAICPISSNLLKKTALDVKNILKIDDFTPNTAWLSLFRMKYNITDLDMRLQMNESGSSELDIEAIIAEVIQRPDTPSCDIEDFDYDHFSANSSLPLSANATKRNLKDSMSNAYDCYVVDDDDDDPPSKYMKFEVDAIKIESDDDSSSKYVKLEDDVIKIDSDDDDDHDGGRNTKSTNNTNVINNLEQALEHLRPLEDFALMKEDYRAIGLISQLEMALQNSKNK